MRGCSERVLRILIGPETGPHAADAMNDLAENAVKRYIRKGEWP
jgi:hypothetical protein